MCFILSTPFLPLSPFYSITDVFEEEYEIDGASLTYTYTFIMSDLSHIEMSRIRSMPVEVWEAVAMQKHPEVLETRDRLRCMSGEDSYAKYACHSLIPPVSH